jgi:hypothetical protein
MRAHFRHLHFNSFPMIERNFQGEDFWPLQSRLEDSEVHSGLQFLTWEFIWECEGSFTHTLCTHGSMWSDSQVSLLAHNLATPYLGHEPKARVATLGPYFVDPKTFWPSKWGILIVKEDLLVYLAMMLAICNGSPNWFVCHSLNSSLLGPSPHLPPIKYIL